MAKRTLVVLLWVLAVGATILLRQSCSRMIRTDIERDIDESRLFPHEKPRSWFQRGGDDVLMFLVAGFAVGAVALLLGRSYRRDQQEHRDKKARTLADQAAEQCYGALSQGQTVGKFVLFLRPFTLDGAMYAPSSPLPTFLLDPSFWVGSPPRALFEEYLTREIMSAQLSLISLGQPSALLGAGRIETLDEEWFRRFSTLAEAAISIALVPGSQPGIVSEVAYLRASGLLWKTIFFKPVGYSKVEWNRATEALAQERIDLPDWSPGMLSFRLCNTGQVNHLFTWFAFPLSLFLGSPWRKNHGLAGLFKNNEE